MFPREMTVSELERLDRIADAAVDGLQMDEDTFRAFYDRTARQVWAYLARITGDRTLADDLLQESYYRFLRAQQAFSSESHRRNYLFRIATNLANDRYRRNRVANVVALPAENEPGALSDGRDFAAESERRADLSRAMATLKPRERQMLWLAYAQGSSHEEIAESLGLRKASIKILLFRARRRLAAALGVQS
ncbi:MAG TPA: sigma-70 family RNA polymerase sigma factor [Vicinamibacterales bacterium]|nr:sigma-70 family RNA polymerase sigma factor [Vicinamibacterales bacterium]